jgi:hypothetical protein
LGISQSGCSWRYRIFSHRFDLGFDRLDGRCIGTRNGDVLASLRRAAQMHRVRVGQFRFGVGLQLFSLFKSDPHCPSRRLPPRLMDSWGVALLVDQRPALSYGGHEGVVAGADGIQPLNHPLQIVEVGAPLGQRDAIQDSQFEENLKQLSRQLRSSPAADHAGLHWLI